MEGGGTQRSARIGFHEELVGLEEALQQEGELVVRSVQAATRALVEEDLELADEVIAFDDEVDAAYFAIEEGIQSLLARQTPVATDLRLVLAMLHVNLHLERMADYCVTVAKLTKLAATATARAADRREHGRDGRPRRGDDAGRAALVPAPRRSLVPRRSSTSTS